MIGESVRRLREAKGVTLADLSGRCADNGYPLGVNALSRIERNVRRFLVSDLLAVAQALDVPPSALLDAPSTVTTHTWLVELEVANVPDGSWDAMFGLLLDAADDIVTRWGSELDASARRKEVVS